ncbi:hypothetical protein JTB14_031957 [Gonioctena quinquepunctata]|nr:hypothetical protein JTB14_031957 [Gonioctena quinquepunctata]
MRLMLNCFNTSKSGSTKGENTIQSNGMQRAFIEKKRKEQVKRKIFSSSDTESDNSINLDYDSDDDIRLQSLQDYEKILEPDLVLVGFSSENAAINYMGFVTEVVSEDEFEIKYLRRKGKSNKFYFPSIDDLDICPRMDIFAELTRPITS